MRVPATVAVALVAAAVVVLAPACGEKRRAVIERYKPSMESLRADLRALAPKLPPPGAPLPPKAALDPKPTYKKTTGSTPEGNVDFLPEEKLADPEAKLDLDLYLAAEIDSCLAWTGPKNPMSETALGESDGDFEKRFERAKATRYLVVVRTSDLRKAAIEGDTYQGGAATVEAFLFDLPAKELKATVRVSSKAEQRIEYSYKNEAEKTERARSAVMSSLWSALRKKLGPALEEATGGTFQID